ncbi:MAG: MBL fold metallo-hydrolase [Pseudomonadota bacterium]
MHRTTRTPLALLGVALAIMALGGTAHGAAAPVDFDPPQAAPGNMRFAWIHGSISAKHNADVRVQVHRYNEHTYILRQNPAVHWEAPFMYLLIGEGRAVLIDTGATEETEYFPLRPTVERVLARWADARGVRVPHLSIVLTGDAPAQTAGLGQFEGRPETTIIETGDWTQTQHLTPGENGVATLSLGGDRQLTLLPTPGVSAQGLSVYDPYTDFLFTGTSVLPGRIVVRDYDAYAKSIEHLAAFAGEHPVKWLMGAQIDMSAEPGVDYRLRSNYRPNEHALELSPAALADCQAVVTLINGREWVEVLPDFIVMHGVGRGERPYGYPVYTPQFLQRRWLR